MHPSHPLPPLHPGGDDFAPFRPQPGRPALTGAFARRAPMMPWRTDRPVLAGDLAAHVAEVQATPASGPRVAYLHIPFCHSHCLFCGFYQNPHDPEAAHAFATRLVREIETTARQPLAAEGEPIRAVFLGGGTPTALAAADIGAIVGALRRHLPLAEDCEITLEGRSFALTPDRIDAALAAGVTRMSIGVQSFDTRVRRRLGRKLDRAQLVAALRDLAAHDVITVIDLIYGLPGQDAALWREDVAAAGDLGLDGLDFYALSVLPGGPLERAIAAGKALPTPDLATQAEAYAFSVEHFAGLGWRRLSQAHVARTASERSLYNRLVKQNATCLAFGPGAGGSAHGRSWRNTPDIAEWSRRIDAGESGIGFMAIGTPRRRVHAEIRAQLEDANLDAAGIEALAPGFIASATPLLAAWDDAGLGAWDGRTFRTTVAGDFWMTTLAAGLIAASERIGEPETRRSA